MGETVPVLQVGKTLLATLPAGLADSGALVLQKELSGHIVRSAAASVVLDLSAVAVVDSFLTRTLAQFAEVCRILSAETVVMGLRPKVAITLVELGLRFPGLRTARTLDVALRMAQARATGQQESMP